MTWEYPSHTNCSHRLKKLAISYFIACLPPAYNVNKNQFTEIRHTVCMSATNAQVFKSYFRTAIIDSISAHTQLLPAPNTRILMVGKFLLEYWVHMSFMALPCSLVSLSQSDSWSWWLSSSECRASEASWSAGLWLKVVCWGSVIDAMHMQWLS